VKTSAIWGNRWRDHLGWLVGADLANVAEVRILSLAELDDVNAAMSRAGFGACPQVNISNTWLVRDASDYRVDELPRKTADQAVAWELVYSVWIRRRDPHAENRAYSNGLPVFFDHHIAFGEEGMVDLEQFLRPGPDHGYVPNWRVVVCSGRLPTAEETREEERRTNFACQYVQDRTAFERELETAEAKIAGLDVDGHVDERLAGHPFGPEERQQVAEFLEQTQTELSAAMHRVRDIIASPAPGVRVDF